MNDLQLKEFEERFEEFRKLCDSHKGRDDYSLLAWAVHELANRYLAAKLERELVNRKQEREETKR
jgi:hypothetical protein